MPTVPSAVDLNADINVNSPPIKMKSGAGYLCKLSGPELQFPRMAVPWKIGVRSGLHGGPPNCKLSLKFNAFREDLSGNHKTLAELLDGLDDLAVEYIIANKKLLFSKPKSDAVIRETFTRSIKTDAQQKYTPTVSAKVDFAGREQPSDSKRARTEDDLSHRYAMDIGCYTKTGDKLVAEDVLVKDSEVQAVVIPQHIWVTGTGMGITYKADRCVVVKQATERSGFDFDLDQIEDDE